MAQQEQLDGAVPWYTTLLTSAGQQLANNIAPAEKTADQTGSEDLSGAPTAPQRMAGAAGEILNQRTLMLVGGGILALVTVIAVMGSRK